MTEHPPSWPKNYKRAVSITFDMDADSLIHLEKPDDSFKRVSTISHLRYGPEVAVSRILDTYKRLGLRQTFFIRPGAFRNILMSSVESLIMGMRSTTMDTCMRIHLSLIGTRKACYSTKESISFGKQLESLLSDTPRIDALPYYKGPVS